MADKYVSTGSNTNISDTTEWNTYLKPSSPRAIPTSGTFVATDKMAHGRRMIYPIFFGDLVATYGSSEYLKLVLFGNNGDFFGVNDKGSWTVSSSTSTTLTCNDAAWKADEHKDRVIFFNGGQIDGARAVVAGNTSTTLTLDVALSSLPAQGDSFTLFDGFYQIAIPYTPSYYFSNLPAIAIKAV
jgi:hypothetical protein